ncbi:MAG: CheR family methyltransferase [Nitrospirota bacterium]
MPEQLLRYAKSALVKPPLPPKEIKVKPLDVLQKIFVTIRSQTGHDFSQYKYNTVMRRIERRMAVLQISEIADYLAFLRNHPDEVEILFKELLIRVTNFFRDPEAYEALKTKGLPIIFQNRPHGHPVRLWVPGCSTGEEAYSLAIIFNEYMQDLKGSYKLQIFATDIDSGALEVARAGVYSSNISVDVSPERLANFFVKKDNTYKVKEEIRESIVFAVQNVIKDPPFSKLDMISCRNLLIYLSAELQRKVLPLFRYALNPDGILFLGSSESIGDTSDLFSVVDKKWKIYKARKTEIPALMPFDLRPAGRYEAARRERPAVEKEPREVSIGDITCNVLLEYYTPPSVIVDRNGDILYIHGRTGKYLEPAAGKATLNIFEMAREGLRLELRTALRQAFKQSRDIAVEGLNVKTNGDFQMINLDVKYIKEPESLRGLMMVVFRDVVTPKTEKAEGASLPEEKMNKRIADLEFELKSTKEHLQTTIEELETSNEELQATNEELQSSNEELQSTNEELETSKEELQSTNEELMTVNSELQHKMDELAQVNNDMNNLLASTQIATIFLDTDLRIKRFTPSTTEVINLIQSDIGCPMADIVTKLDYPELCDDAEAVLKTLTTREKIVKHHKGLWYLARIMPYRTTNNIIEGVVITFIEITEQKKVQELEDTIALMKGIIDTVREPLIALDSGLRVISANKSFYDTFRVTPGETEGRPIYEIGNRQWDIPELKRLLEDILPMDSRFENFEVEYDFPETGRRTMLLNGRRIEKTRTILLSIGDVTDK